MIIGINTKFDSGHYLPGYPGKCKEMHGHTWSVQVEVEGFPRPETGFVMDFTELKAHVKEVIDTLDHKCLNDIILITPTCEHIALHIKDRLQLLGLNIKSVTVREGDGGYCIA